VIGPLSPDYPAVLTQGEAAFTPAPDVTGFNILHFLNQGDPEVAEDFQRENIHFSGLTFTTPSATVLEHLITFFDIAVYYSGGGPSGVIRHDFPDWYLRDFSIDNCVFDFRETSPQNAGINCIVYCSEFCTFEDISISNNTFYVKNLESTYLDGEEAEKPCKIRILDGTCGSANPNKKIKINNNVFSGSEVGSAGTLPTYLTLYPDGGAYNTKEEFYYEIKGNHFVGNKEYNRIIQSHNIKKMNIDFSENTFGSVQTPYRNDVEWNGTAIFYFLEDNPITFTETQTKNNYYAATPDGTINMFYGVSVDEASINFLYGQQQKTGEELTESLINVIH
ncbi:MAG TPA: hypothetical protein PLB99_14680, partial [Thermotogota bacterium]|nr:hypothetical protein [Thermotogota bacterium]